MSLKYSLTFALLAFACVASALGVWDRADWFTLPLFYTALSFALLAIAYAGAGPWLLFKRSTGRRSILGVALFAPYFLLSAVSFSLYRLATGEPAFAEVVPNVSFGRRLTRRESSAGGWVAVLDLAAEFNEVRTLRKLPGYRSIPVLDATAPSPEQLRKAVAWLIKSASAGPVYVHCALGHGRSACVILAYLLSIGEVKTIQEGSRRLRSLRPGVGLNAAQRRALAAYEPGAR